MRDAKKLTEGEKITTIWMGIEKFLIQNFEKEKFSQVKIAGWLNEMKILWNSSLPTQRKIEQRKQKGAGKCWSAAVRYFCSRL